MGPARATRSSGRRGQARSRDLRAVVPEPRDRPVRHGACRAEAPDQARVITRAEGVDMAKSTDELAELDSAAGGTSCATPSRGAEPPVPQRHRPARQHRRDQATRRQIARINTSSAPRRSERRSLRRPRAQGVEVMTRTRASAPPARSAKAWSCPTRWTRPSPSRWSSGCAIRSTPSSCCAPRSCTPRRGERRQRRRQGPGHGDPPLSKQKRWRVVEVLERAK